jgi:hypothetical protein
MAFRRRRGQRQLTRCSSARPSAERPSPCSASACSWSADEGSVIITKYGPDPPGAVITTRGSTLQSAGESSSSHLRLAGLLPYFRPNAAAIDRSSASFGSRAPCTCGLFVPPGFRPHGAPQGRGIAAPPSGTRCAPGTRIGGMTKPGLLGPDNRLCGGSCVARWLKPILPAWVGATFSSSAPNARAFRLSRSFLMLP